MLKCRSAFIFLLMLVSGIAQAKLKTPTLKGPANGSTDFETSYFVYCDKELGTTHYSIEYATNSSFTNSNFDTGRLSSGLVFFFLNKLKLATTYYWRVKSYSATDSSDWSASWSFTTVTKLKLSNPPDGGTAGSWVYVGWYRCADYDTFEYQIDTAWSFSSAGARSFLVTDTFHEGYMEYQPDFLRFGKTYHVRFRGLNGAGSSDWLDTSTFSTFDSLQIQNLISGQQIPNIWLSMQWSSMSYYAFQLQIDTVQSFDSPALRDTTGPKAYSSDTLFRELMFDTRYYLRLRCVSEYDTSQWTYRTFYTRGLTTTVPGAPSNANPSCDVTISTSLKGIKGYIFEIDTTDQFNSFRYKQFNTNSNSIHLDTLQFGTYYYARVKPYHSRDTGDWSKVKAFYTIYYPSIYYPFSTTTPINVTDSLTWGIFTGIDGFQFQLSESPDYKKTDLLIDSIFPPNVGVIKGLLLKFNHTYYRRVRAWHAADTSDWSLVSRQQFITVDKPTPLKPYNSDFLGTGAHTWLSWQLMKGVSRYEVWVDTSANFNSPEFSKHIVQNDSLEMWQLYFGAIYKWKVRGITDVDTSQWSDSWVFKILNPVRLNWPNNNSTGITLVSLDWNSIDGTTGYIVELDTSPNLTNPRVFTDTVKNSFFHYMLDDDSISFDTKYYWRVKNYHERDTSDWSLIWNFRTRARQSPELIYPANESANIPPGFDFQWKAYSGASSYVVQYSSTPDFASTKQITTSSTKTGVALSVNSTYFWRVGMKNSDGNFIGDWTEVYSFKTTSVLDIPVLKSPANGFTNAGVNLNLQWEGMYKAGYEIQLGTDSTFASPDTKTSTTNSKTYTNLAGRTKYFWRVRNTFDGGKSDWSDVWSFTTGRSSSIEDFQLTEIRLYPQPANNQLTVIIPANLSDGKLSLYSADGRKLQELSPATGKTLLVVGELGNGFYWVHYEINGMVFRQKCLILH
ncbi:MAG: T9SS type A sorting domain-containing protein [Bacteroidetes bacterium]|nr:T9SS type A sorting domain-containing protein [Bacteroidota bacterium]